MYKTTSIRTSLLLIFTCLGCSAQHPAVGEIEGPLSAQDFQTAFEALTPCTASRGTAAELAAMIAFAQALQEHSKTEVRSALFDLYESGNYATPGIDNDAKAFPLMRMYFDVPETIPATQAKYFGGFTDLLRTSGDYPAAWPLEFTSNGSLDGITVCGFSAGPSYSAVDEFDYFDAQVGLRDLSAYNTSCSGRCGFYYPTEICQCDPACSYYEDCCPDEQAVCSSAARAPGNNEGKLEGRQQGRSIPREAR